MQLKGLNTAGPYVTFCRNSLVLAKGKMEPAQSSLLLFKSAIMIRPVKLIHMGAEGLRGYYLPIRATRQSRLCDYLLLVSSLPAFISGPPIPASSLAKYWL